MKALLRFLPATAMILAAAPALAQPAEEPSARSPDDIIVEGERITAEEARHRATQFVRTIAAVPSGDSMPRWTKAVCPRVLGLSDDHAALVEGWFRDVARVSGAEMADAGCQTNVLILFVGDGAEFVRLFKARYPKAVAGLTGPDIRNLVESDAPVRWWHSIERKAGGGTGSLIYPTSLQSVDATTIVIDVNRAEGTTLRAVTTYAAFVSLAGARARADPRSASILNLFEKPPGKGELSATDREFLTALYTIPHERQARHQRGKLVKAILAGQEAER